MKRFIMILCGCCVFGCEENSEEFFRTTSEAILNADIDTKNQVIMSVYLDAPREVWESIEQSSDKHKKPKRGVACTATLINPNTLITSGECLNRIQRYKLEPYVTVRASSLPDAAPVERIFAADRLIVHPKFEIDTLSNNLGIVRLKKSIPKSFTYDTKGEARHVRILKDWEVNSTVLVQNKRNAVCQVSGFGENAIGVPTGARFTGDYSVYALCSEKHEADDLCKFTVGSMIKHYAGENTYKRFIEMQDEKVKEMLLSDFSLPENNYMSLNIFQNLCDGDEGAPLYGLTMEKGKIILNLVAVVSTTGFECNFYATHTALSPYWEGFIKQYVQEEACDSGEDEDGDRQIDCEDSDCRTSVFCKPEICDNKVDDNDNGKTDCEESACKESPNCREICDNKIDDNKDGIIDCEDSDCRTSVFCKPEICDNKVDDNDNGKTDCEESACKESPNCREICDNKIDDNKDGIIDCEDPRCLKHAACKVEICDNGVDDNGNRLTDCSDPQCALFPKCKEKACVKNGKADCDNPNCKKTDACKSSSSCSVGGIRTTAGRHAGVCFALSLLLLFVRRGRVRRGERNTKGIGNTR